MLRRKRTGQSSVEYTILIIIVLGAFIAAGTYFKRGVQGRWKAVADDLGDQYDPRAANTSVLHVLMSNIETQIITVNSFGKLHTTRFDIVNSIETKTGSEVIGAY